MMDRVPHTTCLSRAAHVAGICRVVARVSIAIVIAGSAAGATWTKAGWLFAKGTGSFQPAKFASFGRDYAGVPDTLEGFVYLYGPRQSSDRGSGNRLYLARVPRTSLRERAA